MKLSEADFYREDHRASLPGNGERGLKLLVGLIPGTGGQASLPGNGERGLKHEHPVGWVDTAEASLPGNGERGLKRRLPFALSCWSFWHRSPATGSVD